MFKISNFFWNFVKFLKFPRRILDATVPRLVRLAIRHCLVNQRIEKMHKLGFALMVKIWKISKNSGQKKFFKNIFKNFSEKIFLRNFQKFFKQIFKNFSKKFSNKFSKIFLRNIQKMFKQIFKIFSKRFAKMFQKDFQKCFKTIFKNFSKDFPKKISKNF